MDNATLTPAGTPEARRCIDKNRDSNCDSAASKAVLTVSFEFTMVSKVVTMVIEDSWFKEQNF